MNQELLALVTTLSTEGSTAEIQLLAQAVLALQPAAPVPTPVAPADPSSTSAAPATS